MAWKAEILGMLGLLALLAGCADYGPTVDTAYPERSGKGSYSQTPYQGK